MAGMCGHTCLLNAPNTTTKAIDTLVHILKKNLEHNLNQILNLKCKILNIKFEEQLLNNNRSRRDAAAHEDGDTTIRNRRDADAHEDGDTTIRSRRDAAVHEDGKTNRSRRDTTVHEDGENNRSRRDTAVHEDGENNRSRRDTVVHEDGETNICNNWKLS